MKRLTFFDGNEQKYGVRQKDFVLHITCDGLCYGNVIDKLGQREDIEEKLGIDLITLFKALTKDVYVKQNNKIIKVVTPPILLKFEEGYCFEWHYEKLKNSFEQCYLKDYGKTWALDKKELTKEELL